MEETGGVNARRVARFKKERSHGDIHENARISRACLLCPETLDDEVLVSRLAKNSRQKRLALVLPFAFPLITRRYDSSFARSSLVKHPAKLWAASTWSYRGEEDTFVDVASFSIEPRRSCFTLV